MYILRAYTCMLLNVLQDSGGNLVSRQASCTLSLLPHTITSSLFHVVSWEGRNERELSAMNHLAKRKGKKTELCHCWETIGSAIRDCCSVVLVRYYRIRIRTNWFKIFIIILILMVIMIRDRFRYARDIFENISCAMSVTIKSESLLIGSMTQAELSKKSAWMLDCVHDDNADLTTV